MEYAQTGFQSACAEYAEDELSLDTLFFTNPPAMFPVLVGTDSLHFHFKKGDRLIIDRSLNPRHGDIVVAVISNNFVFARFVYAAGVATFMPMNKKVGQDELGEDFIWGVVSSLHRKVRS